MRRFNLKVSVTILVIAIVAILLASPISSLIKNPSSSEYYGNVVVEYYQGGNGIELQVSVDKAVFGYIANVYVAVPYADFRYLGAWSSRGGKVLIPTEKWLDEVMDSWLSATGSRILKGNEYALLIFLSFVTRSYIEYDKIVSAPIDFALARSSRVKVIVEVKLSGLKPSGFIDVGRFPKGYGCWRARSVAGGESSIDVGCGCYSVRWVFPENQHWSTNGWVSAPIVLAFLRSHPKKTKLVQLSFGLEGEESSFLATLIGIIPSDAPEQRTVGFYHVWKGSEYNLHFAYSQLFFNDRWSNENPHYHDDAILALTAKVSGTIINFAKQEKYCKCSWCNDIEYQYTNEHAVLITEDLLTHVIGKSFYISMNFSVDDNPYDGSGFLEKYIDALFELTSPYHNYSRRVNIRKELALSFSEFAFTWPLFKYTLGAGIDVKDLIELSTGKRIPINMGSESGLLPLYGQPKKIFAFSAFIGIRFSTHYDWTYVSIIDFISRGVYRDMEYQECAIPVYLFDSIIS